MTTETKQEPWIDPSVELEPGMQWAVRGQPLGEDARVFDERGAWRAYTGVLCSPSMAHRSYSGGGVYLLAVRAPAAASLAPLRIPDGWEMVPAAADVSAWVARGEGDVGFDDFVPGLRYFEPGTDQDMHEVAFCEVAGLWPPCEGYGVTWCLIRRVEPEQRAAEPRKCIDCTDRPRTVGMRCSTCHANRDRERCAAEPESDFCDQCGSAASYRDSLGLPVCGSCEVPRAAEPESDRKPRDLGCLCQMEEGDSDCPVHGSCYHCGESGPGELVRADGVWWCPEHAPREHPGVKQIRKEVRRTVIAKGYTPAWDGGPSGSVTGQPHVPREVRDAAAIVVETIEGAESECDALAVFRRCERREGRTLVSLRALHLRMLAERDETWVRGGYAPEPRVDVGVQEQSPWAEDL